MKNIRDFDVVGKRILVRCDFNVPLDGEENILDDFKIKQSLGTIKYLIEHKAKIILMSHLDPERMGFVSPDVTLRPVARELSQLLNVSVDLAPDCVGSEVEDLVNHLENGQVILLENLRMHIGEKDNLEQFSKNLASLADIYINDAFAECHRAYASIVGITNFLPSGAGLLLEQEIQNLTKVLENPEKPIVVLIGGKKVEDKVKFIERMLQIADYIIVSGLIKKEINDNNMSFEIPEKIISPDDNLESLDISKESINKFREYILKARTIIWNGPFGNIEDANFINGTLQIAEFIIKSGAYSVVGGGSTVDFIRDHQLNTKFNHVSTGGGAMLEFLSGEELPGIKALENK